MENDIITYNRKGQFCERSYGNATQVAISAKMDDSTMAAMDAEMKHTGAKRNRLINLAVRWYLEELDDARRETCEASSRGKYILKIDASDLPGIELERLDYICRGFGCTKESFALHALELALQDYDKNPYRYMP